MHQWDSSEGLVELGINAPHALRSPIVQEELSGTLLTPVILREDRVAITGEWLQTPGSAEPVLQSSRQAHNAKRKCSLSNSD